MHLSRRVANLQVFDGLFGHQLFLLVPLHAAHHAGPDDADHGLLREVGLFHLLFGEGNNLNGQGGKQCCVSFYQPLNTTITFKEMMQVRQRQSGLCVPVGFHQASINSNCIQPLDLL